MELVYKNYFDKFDIYLNENLQLCVGMVMPTTTGVREVQLFCRTVNSVAISKLSHLAIVLNDGNLNIYIDGINQKLEGSNTNISGVLGAASQLRIGAAGGSTDLIWYTNSSEVIILDIQNVLSFTSLGAVDRYNFPVTITANNVPEGFAFDSSTGYVQNLLFRGVNTPFTTNSFTVTATDAFGSLTSRSYYLKVIPAVFIFTNSVTLTYSYSQNYGNISSPGKISYNPSSNSFGLNRYDINNSDQFFSLVTNIGTRACYFSIEHANGSMLLKTGYDSTGYGYLSSSNSIVISGNAITYSGPAPIFTSNIPAENETVKLRISPVDTSPVTFSSAGSNLSSVVTTDLLVHLDAGDTNSYSGSGSIWRDLSGNNNNFNIVPGAYNSFGVKYMNFGGGFGIAKNASDISLTDATGVTYVIWCRVLNSNTNARTLTRAYGGDHHVFISSGAWDIGAYDNDAASFYGTGYSQQSLPNYGTSNWIAMYWRWQATSPYYELSFNDTPGFIRGSITNTNARYNRGFGSIGGYHNNDSTDPSNASQFWGDISVFMAYNRRLTNDELLQNFRYYNSRFNISGTSGDPVISSSNIVYNVVTNSYYEGRNLFWDTFAGETSALNFTNGVNSGNLTVLKGNAAIALSTVPVPESESKALIFGVRESLGGPLVGINNALLNNFILNVLIAGGGAGGQYDGGGGGGAGGLVILNLTGVLGTSYDITVGAGGGAGGNGTNSVFGNYTALGGGTGGRTQGQSGGSGGGGNMFYSYSFCTGGPGIQNSAMGYGLGNSGGNGNTANTQSYGFGGGGGGSGGVGVAATNGGSGIGGPATASNITGASVFYCGGGGGGALTGGAAAGGGGGAGGGGNNNTVGGGASANTGSGGGGGGGNSAAGGPGGSGVVILAYPTNYGNLAAISAGLTFAYDATTRLGYKVYRFTGGTGTITFPSAIAVQPLPGAPIIGTATLTGASTATVSYVAPDNNGGSVITSYTAVSTPGGITAKVNQAGSGVITVTGLSPNISYTFIVFATNANGNSRNSAPSNQIITPAATLDVEYLVVAGGGAGGSDVYQDRAAGGGGAGGMRTGTLSSLTIATAYSVTIGGGGAGVTGDKGNNGSNSVFSSITSTGGGGGAGHTSGADVPAGNGGSGGGSSSNATAGARGTGIAGQGNNGGSTPNSQGGAGLTSSITGISLTYAGGGGAGNSTYTAGGGGGAGSTGVSGGTGGGAGGGGAGGTSSGAFNGTAGLPNTGGGGGGGREAASGNGGSGIVIIKIPSVYAVTVSAGLTFTNNTTAVEGSRILSFTAGTGTVTFS